MPERIRSKLHTFENQIEAAKAQCLEQMAELLPSPQRDALIDKLRQLDSVVRMNEWLRPQRR